MKKKIALAAICATLLIAVNVPTAMAYFTDRDTASGEITLALSSKHEMNEDFAEWTKKIVLDNTGDTMLYFRVKAFAPDGYTLNYSGDSEWSLNGDYYYYASPVAAGESTSELDIKINVPAEEYDSFDVVVIYESVPALTDENGNSYADWTMNIMEGEPQ